MAIRRWIEEISVRQTKGIVTFLDFSKAFDSILHSQLRNVLMAFRIPKKLISAILSVYSGHQGKLLTGAGVAGPFPVQQGVLQGDSLSPFTFVMTLDLVLKLAIEDHEHLGFEISPRKSTRHPAKHLTNLCYADDCALFSSSFEDMQKLLCRVEEIANRVGLRLNQSKTSYMLFGQWNQPSCKKEAQN